MVYHWISSCYIFYLFFNLDGDGVDMVTGYKLIYVLKQNKIFIFYFYNIYEYKNPPCRCQPDTN